MITKEDFINLSKIAHVVYEEGKLNQNVIDKLKPIFGEPLEVEIDYHNDDDDLPFIKFERYRVMHDCDRANNDFDSFDVSAYDDEDGEGINYIIPCEGFEVIDE